MYDSENGTQWVLNIYETFDLSTSSLHDIVGIQAVAWLAVVR